MKFTSSFLFLLTNDPAIPLMKLMWKNGKKILYMDYVAVNTAVTNNGVFSISHVCEGNATKVEPQTLYEVHIVGVGSSGDGDVGVQSIHTRPDSSLQFLEPPGNLQAEPTSSTTINLTWISPQSVHDIAYYNVSYSSVRFGNENIEHHVHTSSTSVEIDGLNPFTLYEFKVRTHDHNNKYGPYSQKLECRTMEGTPSVVRDVQCKSLNSSSIRVTWKEPLLTNGIISGYIVLYTEDAALPLDKWKELKVPSNRISSEVTGLQTKTRYAFSLRAATQAGLGLPSSILKCNTPVAAVDAAEELVPNTLHSTQPVGILVGLAIAVAVFVISVALIVWKRHCVRRHPAAQADNGLQHVNGNGYYRDWDSSPQSDQQKLELHLTTMAPNIPPVNHNLLDTKGGYPNGQVNGMKHPFLSNGRIPNGHGNRSKCSVHITENPQVRPSYNCDSPGQLVSSQESKVDDEDDRALPDQQVPLLKNSHNCMSDREEDCIEMEEDEFDHDVTGDCLDTANSTQLTELDASFEGNICTGTGSSSHTGSSRNGNSGSMCSNRDNGSRIDCVVSNSSHLSLPQ